MRAKPERVITVWFFKCKVIECEEPYGHMYIAIMDADREWYAHRQIKHRHDKAPDHFLKRATFRRVKE